MDGAEAAVTEADVAPTGGGEEGRGWVQAAAISAAQMPAPTHEGTIPKIAEGGDQARWARTSPQRGRRRDESDLIEVCDGDDIALGDGDRAGEHVFELDLVAGPTVLDQSPERARIEAHGLTAHAYAEPGQPIAGQRAKVFGSCSQRRKGHRSIAEPIGEQRIEPSGGDEHVDGRGDRYDERNIERCGVSGGRLPLGQRTGEERLRLLGQRSNRQHHQRSSVREAEWRQRWVLPRALLLLLGPCGIDHHERTRTSSACSMHDCRVGHRIDSGWSKEADRYAQIAKALELLDAQARGRAVGREHRGSGELAGKGFVPFAP